MTSSRLRLLLLVFAPVAFVPSLWAVPPQDVALQRCGPLFLVPVSVEGHKHTFLLDTGATTVLDLKTFRSAFPETTAYSFGRVIELTTVTGRKSIAGRRVHVSSLGFAGAVVRDFELSALDLSGIGSTCNHAIEGVLGADLLEQLGVIIDMPGHAARLRPDAGDLFADVRRQFEAYAGSFNRGDAAQLAEFLHRDVQWFSPLGEARGRSAVLAFLADTYFAHRARLTFVRLDGKDLHVAGDSYWMNYEYKIEADNGNHQGRGTVFASRRDG